MPLFLHSPSNRIVESCSPAQTARYRRSANFTELDPDSPTTPTDPETSPSEVYTVIDLVGDRTVSEVLEWVGENRNRARNALEAERAGRQRKTLIRALEQ